MATVVRVRPPEVRQRLSDLGLTRENLLDVIQAVSAAHGNCTENDPPAAKCWDGWRMGTRRAREVLRPLGWDKDDTDTFSVVVNHKDRVRLVVVNSTLGTGLETGAPLNAARKGPRSRDSALANRQMVFDIAGFREEMDRRIKTAEAAQYATWCLCVFVDGETVRAEISQPVAFSRGFVTRWEERILLIGDGDPMSLVQTRMSDDDDGLSPDFPIFIQRK